MLYEVEGSGGVRIGGDANIKLTYRCRLRLKAGSVDEPIGFIWVPVLFRAKTSFSTYNFYDLTGNKIPHLVRKTSLVNGRSDEVRALVYLEPSTDDDVEFVIIAN